VLTGAPAIATPKVMGSALGTFFVLGGLSVAALAGGAGLPHRPALVCWAVAVLAVATGGFLLAAGHRLPRAVFSPIVALGTVLITLAVVVAPTPATALAASGIYLFIVIDVVFFFDRRDAVLHTVGVVVAAGWSLHRAQVPWGVGAVLCLVALGIALVVGRLVRIASHVGIDALTGLVNRRGFEDTFDDAVALAHRTGAPLTLSLLDLDHFKAVNDTGGHAAGDALLREFGRHLLVSLPAGAVACRFGGDEFGVLMPGSSAAEVAVLVEAARPTATTGFSCGVADLRRGDSAAELFRRADSALYAAKEAGRGRSRTTEDRPPHPAPAGT
jgi:diguanylate cyclase (GGDEF)-like protein